MKVLFKNVISSPLVPRVTSEYSKNQKENRRTNFLSNIRVRVDYQSSSQVQLFIRAKLLLQ